MATALGSSLPTPVDATTAATAVVTTAAAAAVATAVAVAAATTEAAAAAAPVQDDPKDPVDAVIASALEGINLALFMDNPLSFPAMSPVS